MGTFFSCVLKSGKLITGPGPDPGGDTDPGGGCDDPTSGEVCDDDEDDPCTETCIYYYCEYTYDVAIAGDDGIRTSNVDVTGVVDPTSPDGCTAQCPPIDPITGGRLVPPDTCLVDVDYHFCTPPVPLCSQGDGCLPQPITISAPTEEDAPDEISTLQGTGYKNREVCKAANNGCCDLIPPPPVVGPPPGGFQDLGGQTCDVVYCVNGEIRTATLSKFNFFGGDCPSDGGTVIQGITYFPQGTNLDSTCGKCNYWECNNSNGECEQKEDIYTNQNIPIPCPGYEDKTSCENSSAECCEDVGSPDPIDNILANAYGAFNIPANDTTGDIDISFCPGVQNITYVPPANSLFNLTGPDFTGTIQGIAGATINGSTGAISIPINSLSTGMNSATITFTRQCGGGESGSFTVLVDSSDINFCTDYDTCIDSVGQDCGFDPSEPVYNVQLIQLKPLTGPNSQPIQFITEGGYTEWLYLNPDVFNDPNGNLNWEICDYLGGQYDGSSTIDVFASDINGNNARIVDISFINDGVTSFDITAKYPVTADNSRWRVELANASLSFNMGAPPYYVASLVITDTDTTNPTKTIPIYLTEKGNIFEGIQTAYPKLIDCGSPTEPLPPGPSVGQATFEFASNNLRNRGANTEVKASGRVQAKLEYLDNLIRRRNSETVFDPVLSNKRYRTKTIVPFIPHRGSNPNPNIFSRIFDYRIELIRQYYLSEDTEDDYSQFLFSDLTLNNISRSLTKEARRRINALKNVDGSPLAPKILTKIRDLIITDAIRDFSLSELDNFTTETTNPVPVRRSVSSSLKTNQKILDVFNSSYSLHLPDYSGQAKERIRHWKTIASDLRKQIAILETDGTIETTRVSDEDLVDVVLSDGTLSAIPITDFDTYPILQSNGFLTEYPLDTQSHRSKVLNFEDLTRLFTELNETYTIRLEVSSGAPARVEEQANLEDERADKYILKLDTDSFVDLDRSNPLIRLTDCTYSLMTDEEEIEEWISTKPYPFFNFYINHEDPFLDHLELRKKLKARYKDISLDAFAYVDEYPVTPRRIPWYIVIIPTDRNDLISSIGKSRLLDYHTRVINYQVSPVSSRYKQNWEPVVLDEEPGEYLIDTRTDREFYDTYTFKFNPDKVKNIIRPYKRGAEPLPRRPSPARALFTAIRDSIEAGDEFVERNSKTISWGSVYKRMSKKDKKAVALVEAFNFSNLRTKLLEGKISRNDTVNSELGKVVESGKLNITSIAQFDPKAVAAKKLKVDPDAIATPEILE